MVMTSSVASIPAFSVRRCQPELVRPAKPTPRELKPLSDIDDQEGLRWYVPVLMLYKPKPSSSWEEEENNDFHGGEDPVRVIREALAAALVFYYPLAGRLVQGPNRKLIVDCTAEGALFQEAEADVSLEELGDAIVPPCPNLEKLLCDVPGAADQVLGCPLLASQVTRLKCGGFLLSCRYSHTMCDGVGMTQFLKAVAEIARGANTPSVLPVWQREVLNARRPPRVTCTHHEFEEVDQAENLQINWTGNDIVQGSIFFGQKEIEALRDQLPPNLINSSSRFEIVTACMWRCRTIALELPSNEAVRVAYPINVRQMLQQRVPDGYYGNAFVYPAQVATAESVCGSPLGYAVELVKKVKAQANEEYVRSVADLLVSRGRPTHTVASTYIISDNTRIGLQELDFGWGYPTYSGPAGAVMLISFLVRFKNSKGEEGIQASIALPAAAMEKFHKEFEKMTQKSAEGTHKKTI